MDTIGFGDTRLGLGALKDAPGGDARDVRRATRVGQEPDRWPVHLPVGPQFGQEPGGEQRVAILLVFALLHMDAYAVTVNVRDLQLDRFADPQARAIRRLEHGAMAQIGRDGQEHDDLLVAQDHRVLLGQLTTRNGEGGLGAAQGGMVEKPPRRLRDKGAPCRGVHRRKVSQRC